MTNLVLSTSTSRLLQRLADTKHAHNALESLRAALASQPVQQNHKMTAQSPAVPSSASGTAEQRIVLEHKLLINIASWARSTSELRLDVDASALKLARLVAGAHVHVPPKPVFHRSKQLEDSLAAIRLAQEHAEYTRMSSSTTHTPAAYAIPSTYTNIAGVDPTLSLSQRFASTTAGAASRTALARSDELAWKDAQRQLSVMLNILLSALATATAAWWAGGNAAPARKLLTAIAIALLTALAEIVLYNRYHIYKSQSNLTKATRIKGSDLSTPHFTPLQLDTSSSHSHKPHAPASRST